MRIKYFIVYCRKIFTTKVETLKEQSTHSNSNKKATSLAIIMYVHNPLFTLSRSTYNLHCHDFLAPSHYLQ